LAELKEMCPDKKLPYNVLIGGRKGIIAKID